MMTDKYLNYRGKLHALATGVDCLYFTTVHEEQQPTALYQLDLTEVSLTATALKCGGHALCTDGQTLWLAGSNKRLYHTALPKVNMQALTAALAKPAKALVKLADQRLAALLIDTVAIVSCEDGRLLQTLDLPTTGTTLAAPANGQWLAVGMQDGTVSVFDCEDKSSFTRSDSAKLHEGAVTALCFEAEELRFFSAGSDLKLYSTHARGQLDALDRGRSFNHNEPITCLLLGTSDSDRFYSGSQDKTVKAWSRSSNTQPATLKESFSKIVDLALIPTQPQPQLVVACGDNTLRIFKLDDNGKFGEYRHKVHDVYAWAGQEFKQTDPKRRELALHTLAKLQDRRGLKLIAKQAEQDSDPTLRHIAAQIIGKTLHPSAIGYLETCLAHKDKAVRLTAFKALSKQLDPKSLRPMQLALTARQVRAVPGVIAIEALEDPASKDDRAMQLLLDSLHVNPPEVRRAALNALEQVYGKNMEGTLMGLRSSQADVRRLALLRCYQRQALQQSPVLTAVRHCTEDDEAKVRHMALLVLLLSQPKLVTALRARDKELHRHFYELEQGDQATAAVPAPPAATSNQLHLSDQELAPLLQAMASRTLDTCLTGARGLAILGDARAFGLLLQLSQEEEVSARVEVCRALAALADSRSLDRLASLLRDDAVAVRDAAFTALAQLYQAEPLQSAALGLAAKFEDVRQRGLQVLVQELRQQHAQGQFSEQQLTLLQLALNNSFAKVRSEAFKTALNLNVGGDAATTLQLTMQSIHADVRREALTECMAQYQQSWTPALLLTFFNDPDASLRREAFEFIQQKHKTPNFEVLATALASPYTDTRLATIRVLTQLSQRQFQAAQDLLLNILDDPAVELRRAALEGLLHNSTALLQALHSPHPDVRLIAAVNRAEQGDVAALQPLLALATAPEPTEKNAQQQWQEQAVAALNGLAQLGQVEAIAPTLSLLNAPQRKLREGAANVLLWCADASQQATLQQHLQHADDYVKYRAALGLAYQGDTSVAPLVFAEAGDKTLSVTQQLVATLTLGTAGEHYLLNFLDHRDLAVQHTALLILAIQEWQIHNGTPERLLRLLAVKTPKMRLAAVQLLEKFPEPVEFETALLAVLNRRLNWQDPSWQLTNATLRRLAALLLYAPAFVKSRTLQLINALLAESQQNIWDNQWQAFTQRFAESMAAAETQAQQQPVAPLRTTVAAVRELTFGVYIGLAREQGSYHSRHRHSEFGISVIDIRIAAIRGLVRLVGVDANYMSAAQTVILQALRDPTQDVREFAFHSLEQLGMEASSLGEEALATGYKDIGVHGMNLLSQQAGKTGNRVLENIMLQRNLNDQLELEAAQLLAKYTDLPKVAKKCLNAVSPALREQAVHWLASHYLTVPLARTTLRAALDSRYEQVRKTVAFALANLKDPSVIATLRTLLFQSRGYAEQLACVRAYQRMGDPSGIEALLHRINDDPDQDAEIELILNAVGEFRHPHSINSVLPLLEQPRTAKLAYRTLLTISGYDQPIDNYQEETPLSAGLTPPRYPRYDEVLAALFSVCAQLGWHAQLSELIRYMRWAPTDAVNAGLMQATYNADDTVRRAAVEALGWRLRKRAVAAEVLEHLLTHRDALTQFLAAEGLARVGHAGGLSILLAAVDLMPELALRERAVHALGELADERALDVLLKLATDDAHALQDTAMVAIGHLSQTQAAATILKLLQRYAAGGGSLALDALQGLRWFNTLDSWAMIQHYARQDNDIWKKQTALELLGDNDTSVARELLLSHLRESQHLQIIKAAYAGATRLFAPDDLSVSYALFASPYTALPHVLGSEVLDAHLQQLAEQGEVGELLAALPTMKHSFVHVTVEDGLHISMEYNPRHTLVQHLLQRTPLPIAIAAAALSSPHAITVTTAAHILGRAGDAAVAHSDALLTALEHWLRQWQQVWAQLCLRASATDNEMLTELTAAVSRLLWACGQLRIGASVLWRVAQGYVGEDCYAAEAAFRPLQIAALDALAQLPSLASELLTEIAQLALQGDARLRRLAAHVLSCHAEAVATLDITPVLSDRLSFQTLRTADAVPVLPDAAVQQVHYQGILLPDLIARGAVTELLVIVQDKQLAEAARLGVIESLAQFADVAVEETLQAVGEDATEEEPVRRAAWRSVKRSRRLRRVAAG